MQRSKARKNIAWVFLALITVGCAGTTRPLPLNSGKGPSRFELVGELPAHPWGIVDLPEEKALLLATVASGSFFDQRLGRQLQPTGPQNGLTRVFRYEYERNTVVADVDSLRTGETSVRWLRFDGRLFLLTENEGRLFSRSGVGQYEPYDMRGAGARVVRGGGVNVSWLLSATTCFGYGFIGGGSIDHLEGAFLFRGFRADDWETYRRWPKTLVTSLYCDRDEWLYIGITGNRTPGEYHNPSNLIEIRRTAKNGTEESLGVTPHGWVYDIMHTDAGILTLHNGTGGFHVDDAPGRLLLWEPGREARVILEMAGAAHGNFFWAGGCLYAYNRHLYRSCAGGTEGSWVVIREFPLTHGGEVVAVPDRQEWYFITSAGPKGAPLRAQIWRGF